MTPDEFWLANRDRIQKHVADIQYGDPSTHADDRVPASSWEQEEAVKAAVEIFNETGVLCDRAKLIHLLEYLVDQSVYVQNPYSEAMELLKQITGGR